MMLGAWRLALGLLEQVAHAAGADADEHLDELRARDAEERHAGLARNGTADQCLARAWRACQQHALGDLGAQRGELRRMLEELDDLPELFLGLSGAGYVVKGDLLLVADKASRLAAA